jgi:hypothetical protein
MHALHQIDIIEEIKYFQYFRRAHRCVSSLHGIKGYTPVIKTKDAGLFRSYSLVPYWT